MLNRNEVKSALREYICRVLIKDPGCSLEDNTSLINGGVLDSFSITDIAVFVDQQFDVYIPNEELDADKFDTLEDMTNRVLYWAKNPV